MTDQLLDMIKSQLGNEDMIKKLSDQLEGADPEQTKAATDGVLATLVAGLARNASSPEGAQSLNSALERDHDGSVLDDFMGSITGNRELANPKALNGQGILGHILGGKQNSAADMISQMSGLGKGQTGKLMVMLAPMIMGALGKVKRNQGLDSGALSSILTSALGTRRQQGGGETIDMISSFLDADGDGDVMDDLGKMGKGLLGGLFGR